MTSTQTILHPANEVRRGTKPTLALRLKSLEGKRVALLDNGKINAGRIIDAAAELLKPLGIGETRSWVKQHASEGAFKLFPDILAWKPDLVLTALGD